MTETREQDKGKGNKDHKIFRAARQYPFPVTTGIATRQVPPSGGEKEQSSFPSSPST